MVLLEMSPDKVFGIIMLIIVALFGIWLIIKTKGIIIVIVLLIWGGMNLYEEYFNVDKKLGCISGDCYNGNGTLRAENINGKIVTYKGSFKNGEKHGKGKLIAETGTYYDGEFRNNKKHGKGILQGIDGTTYVGYWENEEYIGETKSKSQNSTSNSSPCSNFDYEIINQWLESQGDYAAEYTIKIICKNNDNTRRLSKIQNQWGKVEYGTYLGDRKKFSNEFNAAKHACGC